MYTKLTNLGWIILEKYADSRNNYIILVFRPEEQDFAWGYSYDPVSGSWAQGHYNYYDFDSARQALLAAYPNVKNRRTF